MFFCARAAAVKTSLHQVAAHASRRQQVPAQRIYLHLVVMPLLVYECLYVRSGQNKVRQHNLCTCGVQNLFSTYFCERFSSINYLERSKMHGEKRCNHQLIFHFCKYLCSLLYMILYSWMLWHLPLHPNMCRNWLQLHPACVFEVIKGLQRVYKGVYRQPHMLSW